jgi:hypothetical protein
MRGHMLKVEFLTLDPKTYENLQDFFTKYKDLLSQLKAWGVDKYKEEKQMVLSILSKLGLECSVFVCTLHSVRLTFGATWTMPSVEAFINSLTQEHNKLINMGKIKGPKCYHSVNSQRLLKGRRNLPEVTLSNHFKTGI